MTVLKQGPDRTGSQRLRARMPRVETGMRVRTRELAGLTNENLFDIYSTKKEHVYAYESSDKASPTRKRYWYGGRLNHPSNPDPVRPKPPTWPRQQCESPVPYVLAGIGWQRFL